jgi:hypothetical protein
VSKSTIIICPGIHSPQITNSFIKGIQDVVEARNYLILPTEQYAPYLAIAIEQWLKQQYPSPAKAPPLSLIAFSAGTVGGIGAAIAWQLQGGKIQHFIALDGWGMPLAGNFPIYRVSHDHFTHQTSTILGAGQSSFYLEPGVEHLELWRSPDTAWGWKVISFGFTTRCSLINYLKNVLNS